MTSHSGKDSTAQHYQMVFARLLKTQTYLLSNAINIVEYRAAIGGTGGSYANKGNICPSNVFFATHNGTQPTLFNAFSNQFIYIRLFNWA